MAEHKVLEVLAKPDAALEMTLRPSLFSEFTGQFKVKERLEITVAPARPGRGAAGRQAAGAATTTRPTNANRAAAAPRGCATARPRKRARGKAPAAAAA